LVIVLLLFFAFPTGFDIPARPDNEANRNIRPSAIERTLADVLPCLSLATDWATKVEEREVEWMLSKQLQHIEWSSQGRRGCPDPHYQDKIKAILEGPSR
jgi:hypothetical protein